MHTGLTLHPETTDYASQIGGTQTCTELINFGTCVLATRQTYDGRDEEIAPMRLECSTDTTEVVFCTRNQSYFF